MLLYNSLPCYHARFRKKYAFDKTSAFSLFTIGLARYMLYSQLIQWFLGTRLISLSHNPVFGRLIFSVCRFFSISRTRFARIFTIYGIN